MNKIHFKQKSKQQLIAYCFIFIMRLLLHFELIH